MCKRSATTRVERSASVKVAYRIFRSHFAAMMTASLDFPTTSTGQAPEAGV
jgi:hypothetical protein